MVDDKDQNDYSVPDPEYWIFHQSPSNLRLGDRYPLVRTAWHPHKSDASVTNGQGRRKIVGDFL